MTTIITHGRYRKSCLAILNSNVNERKRKRTHPSKPSTTQLQRTTTSLIDAIRPAQLDQVPSEETIQSLEAWTSKHIAFRSQKQHISTILKLLDVHPEVCTVLSNTNKRNPIWVNVLSRLIEFSRHEDEHKSVRFTYKELETAIPGLLSIRPQSDPNDSSSWGQISLDSATEFCASKRSDVSISVHRLQLLKVTGFTHTREELQERINDINQLRLRFNTLKEISGWIHNVTFRDYRDLLRRLGYRSYDEIQTATTATIYNTLLDMPKKRTSYTMVHDELLRYSRHDVIEYLEMTLPNAYTFLTSADLILRQPPWVQQVFKDALVFETEASRGRTSYTQFHTKVLSQRIAATLNYVYQDTAEHHKLTIQTGDHPIQWLFEHANHIMISDLIRRYGQSRTVLNNRVKSSQTKSHHASFSVVQMIRYFKGGFRKWLACKDTIDLVNYAHIIKGIDNKREAADPDKRRTFTDEEVEGILAYAKDPRQELIVTIFREIGLRVSAIGHLRYKMLMNEDGVPRDVCIVPEKGNTKRRFVTSSNLKTRIKVYIDFFRGVLPLCAYKDAFIMNLVDPTKPFSSEGIRQILTELAKEAQIVGVHVHPHAFRHTIVGKLIEAGNSMEHVSKFIGHASTDTTSTSYWVTSIKELNDQMNNPFMPGFKSAEERKEDVDNTHEQDRLKIEASLKIINMYNLIIAKCIEDNLHSREVQRMLFTKMPNLGAILNTIAMSETESNCSNMQTVDESEDGSDNADRVIPR